MNARYHLPLRVAAVSAACAVVGVVAASPAGAAGNGDVKVVNTETVQVYTSPSGQVQTRRVYEQLALTGHGKVDLSNPVSTDNLRNLDGFSGFTVKDGHQVTTADVSGEKRLRSVSDYDGRLPLDVSVAYKLDGKNAEPGDVVGRSGHLEVTYTVRNVTAKPQQVTFDDGKGGTVTKTVPVPIPLVGSLTTTTPAGFTNVTSDAANMGGDGKGGTQLSFTMTLFPPIGSDTAVFGYSADVTDAVIPRAEVSALPVNPLASPTFKSAAGSYKGGADTGVELADGAGRIDQNLLKLRDGASQLLAGLIQLRDGAGQLEVGLAGQAVPGAHKLADGANQLDAGLGQLHSGARRLAAGAGEAYDGSRQLSAGAAKLNGGLGRLSKGAGALAAGADDAFAGSKQLNTGALQLAGGLLQAQDKAPALMDGLTQVRLGLLQVNGGLTTMYDQVGGIPAQAQPIFDGISQLLAGIGSKTTAGSLLYGVDKVRTALDRQAIPALAQMASGVYNEDLAAPGAYQKLSCAATVLDVLKQGTKPLAAGSDYTAGAPNACFVSKVNPTGAMPPLPALGAGYQLATLDGVISGLTDGLADLATPDGEMNDTTLYGGLLTLEAQFAHFPTTATDQPGAVAALAAIECGLDNTSLSGATVPGAVTGSRLPADMLCAKDSAGNVMPGLRQGLGRLGGGIDQLVSGVVSAIQAGIGTPTDTPATTPATLRGGVNGLVGGMDQLLAGGGDLLTGLGQLSDGAGQLADGTGTLKTGLRKLDVGAGKLAAGTADAKAGSGKLAAGAGDLSTGLRKIDVGAGKLANGATDAKDGSGQIAKGANDLATGLEDAANGSSRLKAGLSDAADGAPALVKGAQRLSDEGTKKLIDAGKSTAQSYGEMYATMTAGAERAKTESMAFGAPEGAVGLTAYNYVIQGDDGEGGRNWTRGVGGLAILGAGAGAFALRRRLA